jgi:poly(3-hydroxybutyrate) depolymerase
MGGRDVAFVKALYAKLQGTLCIDETRVFSTGMSYGGIMSNTIGSGMFGTAAGAVARCACAGVRVARPSARPVARRGGAAL